MEDLAKSILSDILDQSILVSSILRQAKVLASRWRVSEFTRWVERETRGYEMDDPLPDYRMYAGHNVGTLPRVGGSRETSRFRLPISGKRRARVSPTCVSR